MGNKVARIFKGLAITQFVLGFILALVLGKALASLGTYSVERHFNFTAFYLFLSRFYVFTHAICCWRDNRFTCKIDSNTAATHSLLENNFVKKEKQEKYNHYI